MGVNLNPGITPFNFLSWLLIQFVTMFSTQFSIQFSILILSNKDYYGIPVDILATKMALISVITDVSSILIRPFNGVVQDSLGRKWPILLGLIFVAASTFTTPMFTTLYPWYCIMAILSAIGGVVLMETPLLPDYVKRESMGMANSYNEMCVCFGFIVGSSVFFQLVQHFDIGTLYYAVGTFQLLTCVILFFGIHDVIT